MTGQKQLGSAPNGTSRENVEAGQAPAVGFFQLPPCQPLASKGQSAEQQPSLTLQGLSLMELMSGISEVTQNADVCKLFLVPMRV